MLTSLLKAMQMKGSGFRIHLSSIKSPQYFMEVINNPHSLKQSNRMLASMLNGGYGFNADDFQRIFKKYSYYIGKIYGSQHYNKAKVEEKVVFVDRLSAIYEKMGGVTSSAITKTLNHSIKQLSLNPSTTLETRLQLLLAMRRYNEKKAISLFGNLRRQQSIKEVNQRSAVYLLELMGRLEVFDRLFMELCIDALYEHVEELNGQQLHSVISSLSKSHYSVVKPFTLALITRVKNITRMSENIVTLFQSQKYMGGLSLIEKSMQLSRVYLPELDHLFSMHFQELAKLSHQMTEKQLQAAWNFVRRAAWYDLALLDVMVQNTLKRGITELEDSMGLQTTSKTISINVLCSALHALAFYNYRHGEFVKYFVKVLDLVLKTEWKKSIHPKHYSRIIWSLCVLGRKEQLVVASPLIALYFQQQQKKYPVYDTLNFYYCYLLLKTTYPKIVTSFPDMKSSLPSSLVTEISLTHRQVYKTFLECGVASIRQYNVNNLICDIFIPKYSTLEKEINNVVVDVHGFAHFMRNGYHLNGSSVLKQRILEEEGYIYHFIPIDQWELAANKKTYVQQFMQALVERYGQPVVRKQLEE